MKRRLLLFLAVIGILLLFASPSFAVETFASICTGLTLENLTPSPECEQMMLSFPEPVVTQIAEDRYTLSNYSFWRVIGESPNLYDSPGGNIIGLMPAGFNFIQAVDSTEGWVKSKNGEWMSTADLKYSPASYFRGVRLLSGLENQFGWVLGDLMTTAYPGGPQSMETGVYKQRYSRVNIFAQVKLDDWYWYMVGPNQWIEQRSVAVAKSVERPEGVEGRWVSIDLYEQTLVAYENDTPIFATLIASGLPGWDTNEGIFKVWAYIDRDRMAGATGAPDAYALESVPWVMYFDDSISLHGTYWHDGFGYRRSHGCVNLSISDANFLFQWMEDTPLNDEGQRVNQVYVYASGQYRGSGPATK